MKQDLTDECLLSKMQEGDTHAFQCLYRRYWSRLYNYAWSRLNDQEKVEGMLQDIFADLWIKRERLNIKTSLSAFLYGTLKHTIIDFIRAKKVRERYAGEVAKQMITHDNVTENQVLLNEFTDAIDRQIEALPKKCGEIFRLSRKEQYSIKEIAQEMEISPKTVENQLIKALKIFRLNLEEYKRR